MPPAADPIPLPLSLPPWRGPPPQLFPQFTPKELFGSGGSGPTQTTLGRILGMSSSDFGVVMHALVGLDSDGKMPTEGDGKIPTMGRGEETHAVYWGFVGYSVFVALAFSQEEGAAAATDDDAEDPWLDTTATHFLRWAWPAKSPTLAELRKKARTTLPPAPEVTARQMRAVAEKILAQVATAAATAAAAASESESQLDKDKDGIRSAVEVAGYCLWHALRHAEERWVRRHKRLGATGAGGANGNGKPKQQQQQQQKQQQGKVVGRRGSIDQLKKVVARLEVLAVRKADVRAVAEVRELLREELGEEIRACEERGAEALRVAVGESQRRTMASINDSEERTLATINDTEERILTTTAGAIDGAIAQSEHRTLTTITDTEARILTSTTTAISSSEARTLETLTTAIHDGISSSETRMHTAIAESEQRTTTTTAAALTEGFAQHTAVLGQMMELLVRQGQGRGQVG